jgi:hypothetical protein
LPDGLDASDDAPVGQYAVQDAHDFIPGQTVFRRVEAESGDVLQHQIAVTVMPPKPLDFPATQRTLAIVKHFVSPIRHDHFLFGSNSNRGFAGPPL